MTARAIGYTASGLYRNFATCSFQTATTSGVHHSAIVSTRSTPYRQCVALETAEFTLVLIDRRDVQLYTCNSCHSFPTSSGLQGISRSAGNCGRDALLAVRRRTKLATTVRSALPESPVTERGTMRTRGQTNENCTAVRYAALNLIAKAIYHQSTDVSSGPTSNQVTFDK
jgi:hypothetical protein